MKHGFQCVNLGANNTSRCHGAAGGVDPPRDCPEGVCCMMTSSHKRHCCQGRAKPRCGFSSADTVVEYLEPPSAKKCELIHKIHLAFFWLLLNVIPFFFNFYLFIHLWLCWVFVSVRGLSLVVASGGHSSSRCAGLSL